MKCGIAKLTCVFTVKPVQFVRIEGRMTANDVVEIENSDDLLDRNLLPIVFWRPTEQAQVITNGLRQIAAAGEA